MGTSPPPQSVEQRFGDYASAEAGGIYTPAALLSSLLLLDGRGNQAVDLSPPAQRLAEILFHCAKGQDGVVHLAQFSQLCTLLLTPLPMWSTGYRVMLLNDASSHSSEEKEAIPVRDFVQLLKALSPSSSSSVDGSETTLLLRANGSHMKQLAAVERELASHSASSPPFYRSLLSCITRIHAASLITPSAAPLLTHPQGEAAVALPTVQSQALFLRRTLRAAAFAVLTPSGASPQCGVSTDTWRSFVSRRGPSSSGCNTPSTLAWPQYLSLCQLMEEMNDVLRAAAASELMETLVPAGPSGPLSVSKASFINSSRAVLGSAHSDEAASIFFSAFADHLPALPGVAPVPPGLSIRDVKQMSSRYQHLFLGWEPSYLEVQRRSPLMSFLQCLL